jgi:hypothetical protein
VRQLSVDQVGEHGFDDDVAAMGDVGIGDRFGGVGEERVIPPHREQRVAVAGVADAAHDQPGSDRIGVDAPKSERSRRTLPMPV